MPHIIVATPHQTEATVRSLLNSRHIKALSLETFYVTDFFGIWYKISRDPTGNRPYDGMASPRLTRQLKAYGVEVGDQVLVATRPYVLYERAIRIVSPITDANRHLVGQYFESINHTQPSLLTA